jgi:hypothetical protein
MGSLKILATRSVDFLPNETARTESPVSERTLRIYAQGIEGCTVCARGLGLRLAFSAPRLEAILPFVSSALNQLLASRTPPVLAVSGLSLIVEIIPVEGSGLDDAQLDLAGRLSREALERGYLPRLGRGRARRPLETARRRRYADCIERGSSERDNAQAQRKARQKAGAPQKHVTSYSITNSITKLRSEPPFLQVAPRATLEKGAH